MACAMPTWQCPCQLVRMTWTECAGTIRGHYPSSSPSLSQNRQILVSANCFEVSKLLAFLHWFHYAFWFISKMDEPDADELEWMACEQFPPEEEPDYYFEEFPPEAAEPQPPGNLFFFPFHLYLSRDFKHLWWSFSFSQTAPVPSVSNWSSESYTR